ncbi:MAG: c-type cytochrome [Sulfurimonas sp.]|nr:c-type cytochrome [Sulfurimonas sp.]
MKTTLTTTLKSLVLAGAILSSSTLLANGAALYKNCAGCHGANGEKVALGKGKVIADMSEDELNKSMNGYLDGTYGGPMKGLMKGQLVKLSKDDISALSTHIVSLKK